MPFLNDHLSSSLLTALQEQDVRSIKRLAVADDGRSRLISFTIEEIALRVSALSYAIDTYQPEVAIMLIDSGYCIDAVSYGQEGVAPLVQAAHAGLPTVARSLLNAGADVDAVTPIGRETAAMAAVRRGYQECFRLLAQHGANLRIKDAAGCTVAHFAAMVGMDEALRAAVQQGVEPGAPTKCLGPVAAVAAVAAQHCQQGILLLLAELGVDLASEWVLEPGACADAGKCIPLQDVCEAGGMTDVVAAIKALRFKEGPTRKCGANARHSQPSRPPLRNVKLLRRGASSTMRQSLPTPSQLCVSLSHNRPWPRESTRG